MALTIELILFAVNLISAFKVNQIINKMHADGDFLTFSNWEREFMYITPWIPIFNTIIAFGMFWIDLKSLLRNFKRKIWFWYVRQITKRYWKIQSGLIKKHGAKWYFDGIDDQIKKSFPANQKIDSIS